MKTQSTKKWVILSFIFSLLLTVIHPVLSQAATVASKYTVLQGTSTNCLPTTKASKNITYTYVSADPNIAAVHKTKGTITPKKAGTVLIKVIKKQNGKSDTATYYQVNVVGMKLSGDAVVSAGNKCVYKTNIKNIKVKWEVTDPTIATISEAGVLTALAQGEVSVIASYKDSIAVKEVSVVSSTNPLQITTQTVNYKLGDVAIFSSNQKNVIWTSSNPSIASIDSTTGLFVAKAAGSVSISAMTKDKKEVASKIITISYTADNRLTIYAGNTNLALNEQRYLTANKNGTRWLSSNSNVISIESNTGLLIAKGYGTATIYAVCGSETAAVQMSVNSNGNSNGYSLEVTSAARGFQLGTSSYLTANKTGTTWFSNNPNVVTVESNTGLLYAKGIGTTTVYAINGTETVSIHVTVRNASGNVVINPGKTTFSVGSYTYLTTNQSNVVWTSSDTNIATIDATSGLLYAKGVGSAVIYVTYANQVAYVPITVVPADYTSQQVVAKTTAFNAISNIPNPVTEYNLDSVKTYLSIAKNKIDLAVVAGVSINDIANYKEYKNLLDSWLKISKVAGTNIPLAVQKVTDITAIETAISSMQSAISTSSISQRLAAVNAIESSVIRAESNYLIDRTEITNYTVYQKERVALGVK